MNVGIILTLMSIVILGFLNFQSNKKINILLASNDKVNNELIKVLEEKRDYYFRLKEDIVRFSILKDVEDCKKVKEIVFDSLKRNQDIISKYNTK